MSDLTDVDYAPEFREWPKTPRLYRDVAITEKIDGTNAAIHVDGESGRVAAQSRRRLITPDDDNYGFAGWVRRNADDFDTIDAVPVLYRGTFSGQAVTDALFDLQTFGSKAAPGWPTPEGICVYHSQSKQVFKVTLDNYDAGKWETAA